LNEHNPDDFEIACGELLEAILILDLGIELDYFPPEDAQRLIEHVDGAVLVELDGFLETWGFVFSSNETPVFAGSLSDGITFTGDNTTKYSFASPLSIPFRSCLLQARLLASDPFLSILTKIVTFEGSEDVWRVAMNTPDANPMAAYLNNQETIYPVHATRTSLLAGFFRILEYIDATQLSWTALFTAEQYDYAAVLQLLHDFSRAQVWRMNLWNPYIQTRMDQLSDAFIHDANHELMSIGARIRAQDVNPDPELVVAGLLSKAALKEFLRNWKTRTKTDVKFREIAYSILKTEPGFSPRDLSNRQLIKPE